MSSKEKKEPRHLGLKLISLILALLLELYFYSPDNSISATIPLLVKVSDLPASHMVIEPSGAEQGIPAELKVSGPRSLVEQVRATANTLNIKYPQNRPTTFKAVVDPTQLALPSGVELESISPASVLLNVERVERREVLVKVSRTGAPPEGYRLDSIKVFPETVVVRGPNSKIQDLTAITTEPVDLSTISGPLTLQASLQPQGPSVALGVTLVTVDIDIRPIEEERLLRQRQITVLAPPGFAATVQPSKADVVLGGPLSALDETEITQFELVADARGLGEGTHQVQLSGELPKTLTIVRTNPRSVTVSLVTNQ